MSEQSFLIFLLFLLIFGGLGLAALYFYLRLRNRETIQTLRTALDSAQVGGQSGEYDQNDKLNNQELSNLEAKVLANLAKRKKHTLTLEQLFYHAGIFSQREQVEFKAQKKVLAVIFFVLSVLLLYKKIRVDFDLSLLIGALAALTGYRLPNLFLDRRISARADEILYYLPLVIEQISIGVSSGLDIGPCIQQVVKMADERDTHNVVTELLKHVEFLVKSGLSLDAALDEVGKRSGNNDLKHAFMALAQVAKHGGEISRQLAELSESVSGRRETNIEGRIKKLELVATGPVALVFAGFLVILLTGFGLQLMKGIG
ncbi:MAG TPA: type II secretion system F family protein [Oligoflexia bacterium]|nr:type II secretion system F family protein [Oligoflexia bacterium]HMP27485.1 type II secretion system F family protein [Oligoflexia bacterium]